MPKQVRHDIKKNMENQIQGPASPAGEAAKTTETTERKTEKGGEIIIHFSLTSILKVIFLFAVLALIYLVRDFILMFVVAIILAAIIDPIADKWQKRGLPRGISVLICYLILFSVLGLILYLLIPPLVQQTRELIQDFPEYWGKLVAGYSTLQDYSATYGFLENFQKILKSVETGLARSATSALGVIVNIFGGLISFLVILVIAFYLVVQKNALCVLFQTFIPSQYQSRCAAILSKIQRKVRAWIGGQLVLCLVVGLLSYIGLSILGVRYALVLGLIAGVTEFIPYLGPILGAIPAVLIALVLSPIKALLVIALYFVIQQLENNLLVPKVMQKAVGLNPLVSIVVLILGAKLAGILGAILAIPVTTALLVLYEEYIIKKKYGQ